MEAQTRREGMKRLTTDDFTPLSIIGRGAFGEVRLVRKNDTGEVSESCLCSSRSLLMITISCRAFTVEALCVLRRHNIAST
jgi:hypothetical protein